MLGTCATTGLTLLLLGVASVASAQPPQGFGGRRGPGGPGGFGPGGPRKDRALVEKFDQNDDGWLNDDERAKARTEAKSGANQRRGFGPPGGPRGRGRREPASPGRRLSPDEVKHYPDADLYDANVMRTIFFEFTSDDWEKELEDFHGTDVDVPATMIVDGKRYPNVGMRFRGMSSYGMVPSGHKRSFNVSIDLADEEQRLDGYKTLNLLNSAGDPSFMSTVLYSHIAGQYIPVPKANHVRVVINGENWGVYVNAQQFNKDFLREHYPSTKGTRWKVSGSPGGDGGLRYFGEDLDEYKSRFDMKSKDGKKAWEALVRLCRTLNETPLEHLERELEPMLDIDETLRFLALDVALVNSDGYWTRASDYSLFLDSDKRFHLVPHDMNEAFRSGHGPGRGPGGPPPGMPGFPPRFGRPEGPGPDRPPFAGGEEQRADGPRGRFGQPGQDEARRPPNDDRRPPGPGPGGFGRGGFGPPDMPGGRRGPGGPGHGGVDLDPLVAIDNPRMPLRSRLLAVPELRAKYLAYVKEIAEKSLDWENLEPFITQRVELIEKDVAADTKKLDSLEAFQQATSSKRPGRNAESSSLRGFLDERRAFLRKYKEPVEDNPRGRSESQRGRR
ncbi:CotH protein [Planctomycetes bacterium Pan216]|uniref:CotH protein n=1 Tax=Kolteria novifilia TaxID=2527975 RepID=A0A518B4S7_9BACT|nr:CotH protein [Planctomycetes bacterium Pan216]